MNLALEEMKLQLERVKLARKEQEFLILKHKQDIKRIEDSIEVSIKKEAELAEKVKDLENK